MSKQNVVIVPKEINDLSVFCTEYRGLHVVIIKNRHLKREWGTDFGWGNGYVIVPKGHALYGKHYNDINVDAWGGLTFSEESSSMSYVSPNLPEGWMVGFDTCHYQDTLERWSMQRVMEETCNVADQIVDINFDVLEHKCRRLTMSKILPMIAIVLLVSALSISLGRGKGWNGIDVFNSFLLGANVIILIEGFRRDN